MTADDAEQLARLLRQAEAEARARITNAVADRFAEAAAVVRLLIDA